jgi:hypothetical protein
VQELGGTVKADLPESEQPNGKIPGRENQMKPCIHPRDSYHKSRKNLKFELQDRHNSDDPLQDVARLKNAGKVAKQIPKPS